MLPRPLRSRLLALAALTMLVTTGAALLAPPPASAAPAPTAGNDPQALFAAANQRYFAGDWVGAAKAYGDIVSHFELEDPGLYHNLGNAYFRSGAYGSAILYYKRALVLEPEGELRELLDANLDAARRTLQARYRASSDTALVYGNPADAFYQVTHLIGEAPLAIGFGVLWLALFALLILRRLRPELRWPGRLAIAVGVFALFGGLMLWGRVVTDADSRFGVVVTADAILRDGKHEVAQGRDLPEGLEVRIVGGGDSEEPTWVQVELASGKRGWVTADDVKQI